MLSAVYALPRRRVGSNRLRRGIGIVLGGRRGGLIRVRFLLRSGGFLRRAGLWRRSWFRLVIASGRANFLERLVGPLRTEPICRE
jgi:hypothetical protein